MANKPYGVVVGDEFHYFIAKESIYSSLANDLGWTEGIPSGKTAVRMRTDNPNRVRVTLSLTPASSTSGANRASSGKVFCHKSKLTTALNALTGSTYNSRPIERAYIARKLAYA